MGKVKSLFKYLTGADILERQRKWNEIEGEKTLGTRLNEGIDTIINFGYRYLPYVLTTDALRRFSNEQYADGTLELLFSAYIALLSYDHAKKEERILNGVLELIGTRSKNNSLARN